MVTEADRSTPLSVLFERFYAEEKECDGSYQSKFRNCLKWFRLHLAREPLLSDLTPEVVLQFFKFCLRRGQSVATVKTYRTRLSALQRFATQKGMTGGIVELPSVVGTPAVREKKRGLPKINTVRHFVEFTLLPQLREKGHQPETLKGYIAVVRWLERFAGTDEAAADINTMDAATVARFQDFVMRGLSPTTASRYAGMLRVILQAAGRIEAEKPKAGEKSYEELAAEQPEGSLLRFLYDNYLLERDITRGAADQLAYAINAFSSQLEHAATFDDLNSQAINRFIISQQNEYKPATIRGRRSSIMAIWNAAWDGGFVDVRPRGVRRIKVKYNTDAWTPGEVSAVVRAVDQLHAKASKTYKGVPKRLYWRSLILAGWDSALRLGDLMRLTTEDYRIQPDGSAIGVVQQNKTGNPIKFSLRRETVEAIEECVASGKLEFRGRKLIWGAVVRRKEVFVAFQTIVAVAVAMDDIKPGTFKYLRRASVTARDAMSMGLGTMAAGHTDSAVTKRHYRDGWQMPAPPPPPSVTGDDNQ
jgi:integrase